MAWNTPIVGPDPLIDYKFNEHVYYKHGADPFKEKLQALTNTNHG